MNNKNNILKISNLHISADSSEIVKGVDLEIRAGEIHVIMGPNGSGKSTLCNAIMGHPHYDITDGKILMNGENIMEMSVDERARKGLFMAFQYPREVNGVTFGNFVRQAVNARIDNNKEKIGPAQFYPLMVDGLASVKMDNKFIGRSLNDGFSGGEKKRAEIVQMGMLKPRFALLDEIDSGLDVDALRYVTEGINKVYEKEKMGILIVTHYERILKYIKPDYVHVMEDGKIVKSGDYGLAAEIEKSGYEQLIKS